MTASRLLTALLAGLVVASAFAADTRKPLFQENFESAEVSKVPENLMLMAGEFAVKQSAEGKYLELPGAPLDMFGLLFGPSSGEGVAAQARILGLKKGRKFPSFGVSLGGVNGYRLMASPAKQQLEIYQGDDAKTAAPFEWKANAWTTMRIQLRKVGERWIVEGKAWDSAAAEPAAWMISLELTEAPPKGRAGVWGSPFSDTPIGFDDLLLTPAAP